MPIANFCKSVPAVVCIPAHNEAADIAGCLAALAVQRDHNGAPIAAGCIDIIVFANSCRDETASIAQRFSERIPHPVTVIEEDMPAGKLNAGWARKRAMDLAAMRLLEAHSDGLIMTTDADSRVGPTWIAATLREFSAGADCVAGYIDASSSELLALGSAFLARGRLEDTYLSCLAEINAMCDPRPHDPWPNHRVSSGASLAVTLAAYLEIGGLPPRAVGEDSALTETLDNAGFKVRHSMDVCVSTSCRFDGRASGGAADTMRHRHAVPDAPCDDDIEPALRATRRALCKGILRGQWSNGSSARTWPIRMAFSEQVAKLFDGLRASTFEESWRIACKATPSLQLGSPLRPSDLPRQIAIANIILQQLRMPVSRRKNAPADTRHHARDVAQAASV